MMKLKRFAAALAAGVLAAAMLGSCGVGTSYQTDPAVLQTVAEIETKCEAHGVKLKAGIEVKRSGFFASGIFYAAGDVSNTDITSGTLALNLINALSDTAFDPDTFACCLYTELDKTGNRQAPNSTPFLTAWKAQLDTINGALGGLSDKAWQTIASLYEGGDTRLTLTGRWVRSPDTE